MHIKQIELKNFQKIKEFSGNFEGNVYLVTGENELGKSTLLKAIAALLTGCRDEVLTIGEEKGFAKIVVGDDGKEYEVELRMTKANPRGTLTIKSKDTGKRSDRLTVLQEIFGYQDFDANEFVSWSETAEGRRKQVQIVKSLLPEDIQKRIADIDAEVANIKEFRKEDNADLKACNTIMSKIQKEVSTEDLETYSQALSMDYLLEEQKKISALEAKAAGVREKLKIREETINAVSGKKEQAESKIKEAREEYKRKIEKAKKDLEDTIKSLDAELAEKESKYIQEIESINAEEKDAISRRDNCKKWLQSYEENKPEDISQKIAEIQHHNEMHSKVEDYQKAKENVESAQKKIADHEKKLYDLASEREKLIKDSELPIKGLNFTDDGLELNGVQFVAGKVSDSQILEVAAKLIIAKNPTVKVFRIARGESLGKKKLEALIDMARKNGYQGFIEQVVREQNELRIEEYNEK